MKTQNLTAVRSPRDANVTSFARTAALIVALLGAGYAHWRISIESRKVHELSALPELIASEGRRAYEEIASSRNAALIEQDEQIRIRLENVAKGVSDTQVDQLEKRLLEVLAKIKTAEAELERLSEEAKNASTGLPEQVELDQLNQSYAVLFSQHKQSYGSIESFVTAVGQIHFEKRHFTFLYLPGSGELVSMRIGKDASTENAELTRAWISEATSVKLQYGYTRVYERKTTSPRF